MKKTILLAIILTVLILLSGCDAMLEIFYPEFAVNYDDNNVLTVKYDLNDYTITELSDLNYNNQKPVIMEIYEKGYGNPMDGSTNYYDSIEVPAGEGSYWFDFFVPSGSFDIWIWQDDNGNAKLDTGDFVLLADKSTPPNFDFDHDSGDHYSYLGDEWATWE